MFRRLLRMIIAVCLPFYSSLSTLAQEAETPAAAVDSLETTGVETEVAATFPMKSENRWLIGLFGYQNFLDTYLSPQEYTGWAHGIFNRYERPTRRTAGRVSFVRQTNTYVALVKSPGKDAKTIDLQTDWSFGYTRNFRLSPCCIVKVGGLGEAGAGMSYNTRNGNNPAQLRFGADIAATAVCEYTFSLLRAEHKARLQVDVPMAGLMFSPQYGQSYYEIFSLGKSDHNICFTSPLNAPNLRLLATIDWRIGSVLVTTGYRADIRQSHVNHLKAHAWTHQFVFSFTTKR